LESKWREGAGPREKCKHKQKKRAGTEVKEEDKKTTSWKVGGGRDKDRSPQEIKGGNRRRRFLNRLIRVVFKREA